MEFTTASSLQNFAEIIGQIVEPSTVMVLTGDLGAGKTTFTQGLAKGLGIQGRIKSPSYSLIKEYRKGRLPLFHIDAYRLEGQGGEDLYLEDYFEEQGVTVIEWGTIIQESLPQDYLEIVFQKSDKHETSRSLSFTANGPKSQNLIDLISEET